MNTQRTVVAFAIPSLAGGGAERVFITLLQNINRERFTPVLILGIAEGALLSKVPSDVETVVLKVLRARSAVRPMIRALRRIRPHVAIGTLGFGALIPFLRPFLPRTTVLISRPGNTFSAEFTTIPQPKRAALMILVRRALMQSDLVVTQSNAMILDTHEYLRVPVACMKRIYNPVDLAEIDRFAVQPTSDEVTRGHPALVAVGRLHPAKGFDMLIEAFSRFITEVPAAKLTILGDGPERGRLESLVDSLSLNNSVSLPGHADNPYWVMAHADLVVSSSRYEGLPNAIIEAQALGVPVVATDCPGGTREIVKDGMTGWLTEVSTEGMFRGLVRAYTAKADVDATQISANARTRFGAQHIVAEWESILDGLVAERANARRR